MESASAVIIKDYAVCLAETWGSGIFPGCYEREARLLSQKTKGKWSSPEDLPNCTILLLLITYTRQLEVLATALG